VTEEKKFEILCTLAGHINAYIDPLRTQMVDQMKVPILLRVKHQFFEKNKSNLFMIICSALISTAERAIHAAGPCREQHRLPRTRTPSPQRHDFLHACGVSSGSFRGGWRPLTATCCRLALW
jgi:hypothetical protein